MNFQSHQPDKLRYFTSDLIPEDLFTHAFFTRIGGVSTGVHTSLNVGLTTGDDPERVYHNREAAFKTLDRHIDSLSDSWLVHDAQAVLYRQPRPKFLGTPPKADIILTDNPEVTLFMRYADCVPIVLVDPVRRAAALAHAGWQGTVKKAAKAAVTYLVEQFGSKPEDLLAVIGPSIGPERYQVGPEVVEEVETAFGADAKNLLPEFNQSTHFDLWGANQLSLQQAGVRKIHVTGICSYDHADEWFSHRASGGKTGRFGVLLALKE